MPPLTSKFGKAVRRLRTEAGYSQERFAAAARINRGYYGAIERGEVNVSLETIERIVRALGVTVARLFAEVDRER